MKPQTHAKIKYATMSVKIAPAVLGNVAKMLWQGYVMRNDKSALEAYDHCQYLLQLREDETMRTYRFYKNGYEFYIKRK